MSDFYETGWRAAKDSGEINWAEGSTAEFKALAKQWQDAGYDVRVQDLEGAEGTVQADIAVRKGQAAPKPEPVPTELSNTANQALAYTEAADKFSEKGGKAELQFGNLDARQNFMDDYKLNLQRRMVPGTADTYGADKLGDYSRKNVFEGTPFHPDSANYDPNYDPNKKGAKL